MKKSISIFALSTALILSGQALAHEGDNFQIDFQRMGAFDDIDQNQDGKISETEYLEYDSKFATEDKEWRAEHWAEMIEKFDANEDNQLEVEEIEDYIQTRMAEVMENFHERHGNWLGDFDFNFEFDDGEIFNGDNFTLRLEEKLGEIDERVAEVMERFHENHARFMAEFDFGGNEFFIERAPGFAFFGPHMWEEQGLDVDEDGQVSEEEFLRGREELFQRLDKNEDGVLDEDELESMSLRGNFALRWHKSEDEDD